MSDPALGLPLLLDLLNEFKKISGYKVNFQKSERTLRNAHYKFKYLGIWVTAKLKDLYKANYQLLLSSLNRDLERMQFVIIL
uniref:Reverse transcriptase n=1 Tax=Denticeps clupeoides TaxID=299321 RepID=A0AAY4BVB8_9TELE